MLLGCKTLFITPHLISFAIRGLSNSTKGQHDICIGLCTSTANITLQVLAVGTGFPHLKWEN